MPINSGEQFQTHAFGLANAACLLGDDVFLSLHFICGMSDISARGSDVPLSLVLLFLKNFFFFLLYSDFANMHQTTGYVSLALYEQKCSDSQGLIN